MALLSGKTQAHYDAVMNVLLQEVRRVTGNNVMNVQTVVSDFEQAVFNAVRAAFANVTLGGCFFHFAQNLWGYVRDIGLAVAYGNDPFLERCLRLCFSLAFIPLPNVAQELNSLIAAPPTQALIQRYPRLQEFFDYIINTYINGNFPPDTWNVFTRGIDTRTNNYVESYFGRWNKTVGATHPSLWTVIRKLKDEQAVARNSLLRANQGYPPVPRKRKWRQMEQRIQNLKTSLMNGQRTMAQYWSAVSYSVAEFQ